MKRIAIVGTSGSGKSTLAVHVSKATGYPRYELDAINWLANWQQRDPDEFKEIVREKTLEDYWVIEGNYGGTREIVWSRATTVIWINLPFRIVFYRMFLRIFKRAIRKEVLWNGNRETLAKHFFTKDSMLYWVIKTHLKRKREYRSLFQDSRYNHLERIELISQIQVDQFLSDLISAVSKRTEVSKVRVGQKL